MVWQPVRIALLFGAVAAVAVSSARAEDKPAPPADKAAPAADKAAPVTPERIAAPHPAGPPMRTIQVTECVPEPYQVTRTAYRVECRQEAYTAYRTECVPEVRTRVCTVYKRVPEVRTEVRNVCVQVPVVEERTCIQRRWVTQQVTTMVCKTVDRGHYECREVPDNWKNFCNRVRHACRRHDCCEPPPCPATKTVKCWVPCLVTEQVPVTTCKRVCVEVPVKVNVTVCRTVVRQQQVQVCTYRCVPEQRTETYTVNVARCVPYQAVRTVRVCVPYQETVTCTRMVARTVTRQVPVECAPAVSECCAPASNDCCATECGGSHGRRHFRFAGLRHREHGGGGHGCGSCCD
jgi:hypothetical protein